MVELLVGMAMGMVVLAGLTMVIIVTLHGNARVDARVEATQNARLTVTEIMEELHSACISPKIAPVKESSSGTKLVFWHAAGGEAKAVEPKPVKSEVTYEGGALWQTDYAQAGGASPEWTFAATGERRKLIGNVEPAPGKTGLFNYYRYEDGALAESPLATPLSKAAAEETVYVKLSLTAEPASNPVHDAAADATVSDSATLRLTPPAYDEETVALPCQ